MAPCESLRTSHWVWRDLEALALGLALVSEPPDQGTVIPITDVEIVLMVKEKCLATGYGEDSPHIIGWRRTELSYEPAFLTAWSRR